MSQQLPDTETLTFKIGLSGTFWDKGPAFSVWVNDNKLAAGEINSPGIHYVTFSESLRENETHSLKIRLENKTEKDTIVINDVIDKDMLLNIESIEIDDIELESVKWSASVFYPDDPETKPVIPECVNLGWNGTYTLTFESPFYLWLLEKL